MVHIETSSTGASFYPLGPKCISSAIPVNTSVIHSHHFNAITHSDTIDSNIFGMIYLALAVGATVVFRMMQCNLVNCDSMQHHVPSV